MGGAPRSMACCVRAHKHSTIARRRARLRSLVMGACHAGGPRPYQRHAPIARIPTTAGEAGMAYVSEPAR
jgi:hypothetical protein